MSKIVSGLKRELKELVPPALFFFLAFQVIAFTQAMMLEEYGIRVSTFLNATIGALIVAKVVLLADLLPIVNRFPDKPLFYNVLWKTAIYLIASLVVRYIEHLIPFWRQYGDLALANRHLLDKIVWPHFWVVQVWLLVLFLAYTALRELTRVLGSQRMGRIFFGPGSPHRA